MFRLDTDAGIARLKLDRPEARNAIPASGWAELVANLAEAESSGARLLMLSGAGEAFCAGADLSDFDAMRVDEDARIRFRTEMRGALDRLRTLSIPTIAAVNGPCFGAGVALAMACDMRISGATARFAITPAKIGISYPQADIYRLVELVGPGQASRLLFTASGIDGAEAERIGLVERHAGEALDVEVKALAAAILSNHADSLTTLKRGIGIRARDDDEQDRSFDALIGAEELTLRLAKLRRK